MYGKGKNFFKDVIFEDNGSGVLGKPGIGGGADEKIHVFFQCGESGPHDKDRDDKAGDSVDGQCGVRRRDQRKYGEGCDEHIGIVFPNSGPQRGGIQFFIYFRDIYDQKCFDRYGDQRHQKHQGCHVKRLRRDQTLDGAFRQRDSGGYDDQCDKEAAEVFRPAVTKRMSAVPSFSRDVKADDCDAGSGAVHEIIEAVSDDSDTVAGGSHDKPDQKQDAIADDAENTGSTAVVYPGFVVVFIHFFTFLSADDIFITAIRCARLGRCVHSMKK